MKHSSPGKPLALLCTFWTKLKRGALGPFFDILKSTGGCDIDVASSSLSLSVIIAAEIAYCTRNSIIVLVVSFIISNILFATSVVTVIHDALVSVF